MKLEYRIPSPHLQPFLTVYAVASGFGHGFRETAPAMLPNLHIRLAGVSTYHFEGSPPTVAPRVSLIGPTRRAYQISVSAGGHLFAAGLLPLGWLTIVRMPAYEVADDLVDGEDLWGRAAVDRLVDRLLACTDEAGLAAELEAFLSDQLRRSPAGSLASASATVDDWLERSAHLSLDRLMDQVGVGARHLRRLTLQTHGMSPKMLAMKYRALRAAASFVVSDTTDLEAEACFLFADQSHLTRDFRQFLGWTPGAFAGAPASLAAATLCGRRRAGATRPLVLLS